ncbi:MULTISPECIES: acyltransferase [unclassified Bradyrhizobium]|uniref:acyltransferase family protein n=1 Tax=unclassified Bradyrhizobium TaxID=2631580 RepID=UPI00143DA319|nr:MULTISPECIES: acyltransferase [unclassified Bradyrhizobium]
MRLLAALQVVYIHATATLGLAPLPGWEVIAQFPGVPIFFAVSGYLVLDSLLRLPVGDFILHRAARIYPALLLNIAVIEALLYFTGQTDFKRAAAYQIAQYFEFYGLTANEPMGVLAAGIDWEVHTFAGFFKIYPSGVLWTLTVELTFYVAILGLSVTKNRIVMTAIVAAMCQGSFVYQINAGDGLGGMRYWPFSISVIPYFWMFGIGMLFRLWQPPASWWKVGVPVLLLTLFYFANHRHYAWFEWKLAPTRDAVAQTIALCWLAVWIGTSPLLKSRFLASHDASYGIYLWHMLIVTALLNIAPADRSHWLILVVLAGAIAAGAASWWLIERPVLRFSRRSLRPAVDGRAAAIHP